MDNFLVWNVRGLNKCSKQLNVRNFITAHNISLFSLLETNVKMSKMGALYQNLCPGWCFTTNSSVVDQGRIVVAWRPNAFTASVELVIDQVIHCKIEPQGRLGAFMCSFVYGSNDKKDRLSLWQSLIKVKTNLPWIVMGDFYVVLNMDERVGSLVRLHEVVDRFQSMCRAL